MEQSGQSQQSNLNLKRQEASIPHVSQLDTSDIAVLRNFIEFLAELKEAQEEEWQKVNHDPNISVQGEKSVFSAPFTIYKIYPDYYTYSCDYPEGHYALNPQPLEEPKGSRNLKDLNCFDISLCLITRMMEGIARGRTSFQDPMNVLSFHECHTLFFNLSIYGGFYNFVPNWQDKRDKIEVNGKDFFYKEKSPLEEMSFCEQVFSQIWILPSLTEERWGMLRNIARFRARDRLRYLYYQRKYSNNWIELVQHEGAEVAYSFRYTDKSQYVYPKSFQLDEIDTCVNEVVTEEERRLRACIDKLSMPLITLAQQKTSRKRKVVERVTTPEGFIQSLQELLQIEQPAPNSVEQAAVVEGALATTSTPIAKVKKVEQKGQSYTYYIELTDPKILPEPCEFTLTYKQGSEVDEVSLQEVESDG